MPEDGSDFVDRGNPFLNPTPTRLDTGSVTLQDGTILGIATFRTPSTTFSAFCDSATLRNWAEIFTGTADAMDGGGKKTLAVAGPGDAALLKQAMKNGRG